MTILTNQSAAMKLKKASDIVKDDKDDDEDEREERVSGTYGTFK